MPTKTTRQKRASSTSNDLKIILKDIKTLQNKVAGLSKEPKAKSRVSRAQNGSRRHSQCKQLTFCQSKTLEPYPSAYFQRPIKHGSTFSCVSRGSNKTRCPASGEQSSVLPLSYVSLQFENIRLERENFNLERQLLQKQLENEKQEKRQLKNKLKKAKDRDSSSQPKNSRQEETSTIKIAIPSMRSSRAPQSSHSTRGQTIPVFSNLQESFMMKKKRERSDDVESMLLSEGEENKEVPTKGKENSQQLQSEFLRLLDQCQGGKKSGDRRQVRQALGDIANKLKAMRQV